MSQVQVPQPPQPPHLQRRASFWTTQLIGVPLLALFPVLALLGVFGDTRATTTARNATLDLEVTYPTRFRYKTLDPLDVSVTNTGDQHLDTVTVSFERAYLDAFSNVQFTPGADTVTDEVIRVDLRDVAPGETRAVSVEIQAERYWRHEGSIKAAAGDEEAAQADLVTFVYP